MNRPSCLSTSLLIVLFAAPLCAVERETASTEFDTAVKPFLAKHCLGCHGEKAKAGYRVDTLRTDFTTATTAEHWKELLDRVNAGEMPPEDKPRPTPIWIAAKRGSTQPVQRPKRCAIKPDYFANSSTVARRSRRQRLSRRSGRSR